jgi:hypothetical protein
MDNRILSLLSYHLLPATRNVVLQRSTNFLGATPLGDRNCPSGGANRPPVLTVGVLVFLLASAGSYDLAVGQVVFRGGGIVQADQTEKDPEAVGFSLPNIDQDLSESIADFKRYCRKSAWEKSFRELKTLFDADVKKMIRSDGGFCVPARQLVWSELLSLPAEGREAFRLFHDANAKDLIERAEQAVTTGDGEELALLRQAFSQYFISQHGDEAADRLGDAAFERGDFLDADRYWRLILDHHPDSEISAARIHVKRGIALANASKWKEFEEVRAALVERFADESIVIGGSEHEAGPYLSEFSKGAVVDSADSPSLPTPVQDVAHELPEDDQPNWRFEFITESTLKRVQEHRLNRGWGGVSVATYVPPTAIDDKRIYLNWLGVVVAIDRVTGKLLWRTDRFDTAANNLENAYYLDLNRYHVMIAGDSVLTVGIHPNELRGWQAKSRLTRLDAETGASKWTTKAKDNLNKFSFVGRPVVRNDVVFACAVPDNSRNIQLLAIDLSDGRRLWSLPIGSGAVAQENRYGQPMGLLPILQYVDGALYLLSNEGGVVVIDPAAQEIAWAFTYEIPTAVDDPRGGWWGAGQDELPFRAEGDMIVRGETLYFKEKNCGTLYCIDLSDRVVKWKRSVPKDSLLAGHDGDQIYVLAKKELLAYDGDTRKLRWSTPLPLATGQLRVTFDKVGVFVFTGRGVYQVNKTSGDTMEIFRGADLDSIGGMLWDLRDRLLCVSNQTITAFKYQVAGSASP